MTLHVQLILFNILSNILRDQIFDAVASPDSSSDLCRAHYEKVKYRIENFKTKLYLH